MTTQTLAGRLLSDQEILAVSGGNGPCFSVPTLSGCPVNPNGTITPCDDHMAGSGCPSGPPGVHPGIGG